MTAPRDLRYTAQHEWVRLAGTTATVGVTHVAAGRLGDVVYADLPTVGAVVEAGAVMGEIESTKSVGELFAPLSGTVTAINEAVLDSPELVNQDPYGAGWLIEIEIGGEPPTLLDADEYAAVAGED